MCDAEVTRLSSEQDVKSALLKGGSPEVLTSDEAVSELSKIVPRIAQVLGTSEVSVVDSTLSVDDSKSLRINGASIMSTNNLQVSRVDLGTSRKALAQYKIFDLLGITTQYFLFMEDAQNMSGAPKITAYKFTVGDNGVYTNGKCEPDSDSDSSDNSTIIIALLAAAAAFVLLGGKF